MNDNLETRIEDERLDSALLLEISGSQKLTSELKSRLMEFRKYNDNRRGKSKISCIDYQPVNYDVAEIVETGTDSAGRSLREHWKDKDKYWPMMGTLKDYIGLVGPLEEKGNQPIDYFVMQSVIPGKMPKIKLDTLRSFFDRMVGPTKNSELRGIYEQHFDRYGQRLTFVSWRGIGKKLFGVIEQYLIQKNLLDKKETGETQ
jgi:hypothetical protein